MNKTTELALSSIASKLLQGIVPIPCPVVAQRAIAILEILQDGQWHTATEIAEKLEIGAKYVRDVLRVCAEGWGLESQQGKGWWMPNDAAGDCRACGGIGYDRATGDPDINCPVCKGTGSYWKLKEKWKRI